MRLSATRLTSICGIGRKAWTPRSLFAPSDLGAWYDPSDLLTLLQDSAGTTPVTAVGQPIGLMLDKRFGLVPGIERVTNGVFDTDTGWTKGAGWSISDGTASVNTLSQTYLSQNSGATGGWYKVTLNVVSRASGELRVNLGGTTAIITSTVGAKQAIVFAVPNFSISVYTVGSTVAVIDNISVRELPGSHARQTTTTARPAYRTAPSFVDYDGIDDVLVTTFASSLGANCTIVRAVPSVGAVILTGQTLGTTYSDNQDHCGLLIINRALTPIETARITNYFNAKSF